MSNQDDAVPRTAEVEEILRADHRTPDASVFGSSVASDTQHAALRASVRQLTTLLGETISRHNGAGMLDLVERVRRLARGSDHEALQGLLAEVDEATAVNLARAFTGYFQLVNTTEQLHRWRELAEAPQGPLAAERRADHHRLEMHAVLPGHLHLGIRQAGADHLLNCRAIHRLFTFACSMFGACAAQAGHLNGTGTFTETRL